MKINFFRIFTYLLVLLSLLSESFEKIEPKVIKINDEPIQITLSKETTLDDYYQLEYSMSDFSDEQKLLLIAVNNSLPNGPGYIYTSFDEKNPSNLNKTFSSQNYGKNLLLINKSKLEKNNILYINIHCDNLCELVFQVKALEYVYLTLGEELIFKSSDLTQIYFQPSQDLADKSIMIYGIGEDIKNFIMPITFFYRDSSKTLTLDNATQKFDNGYALYINLATIESSWEGEFNINIVPQENHYVNQNIKKYKLGVQLVDTGSQDKININMFEHIYGFVYSNENCYSTKNIDSSKKVTMLINSFNQALSIEFKNETGYVIYTYDVFNNYFIKIIEGLLSDTNYFCIKYFTPKVSEEEIRGEVTYDFQMFYTDDLINHQHLIEPLANGMIYTHYLNQNGIHIYRHKSFLKDNSEYSANMEVLRGNPVIYGYYCKTFPNCDLDAKKFDDLKNKGELEIIRPINNHYINKRISPPADSDDVNEPRYESNEQYLTIVRCETELTDPNLGECKYSIEIHHNMDEVYLPPEYAYTTSLSIYRLNYFVIKANSNKAEPIEYLNIYFTSIAGDSDIYIYTDKERNNLIEKKTLRQVYKKEAILINENIQNEYYIDVKNFESAFIEIKYETNYYYRGFKVLMPNEMNIEYVNQLNGSKPFLIQNPHYYYPIGDPKNSDFYFYIRTMDCEMNYKYNFIDYPNITESYFEMKRDDISFGSSFAFELMVSNYLHTNIDNSEDCAIIITGGEKTLKYPLLLMDSIPHPSNFTNSYYQFPFVNDISFKGIYIEVYIDKSTLKNNVDRPLLLVTFKIGNQQDNFETHYIRDSDTFFIKNNLGQYCDKNSVCNIIIEIEKVNNDDQNEYFYYTTVYGSQYIPTYIKTNKVYNQKIISNGDRNFMTQIDEYTKGEINIMFNKGSGKVYAKLVEKGTIEENANWNRRVYLPDWSNNDDTFEFDEMNGKVIFDTASKNNCINGCELYINIKSTEKDNKDTMYTEFSMSINLKDKNTLINAIVELPLNKYIKGYFNDNEYKYYTFTINDDIYKFSINFYSPYGKLYIKLGSYIIVDENFYDWSLIPKNEDDNRIIITASDPKIAKESLKGISFSIGTAKSLEIPEINRGNLFYYFIQVQTLNGKDDSINYYTLSNERSLVCNTGSNNFCHFIIPFNFYYSKYNNVIYAYNTNNYYQGLNIMSIFYDKDTLDKEVNYMQSLDDYFPDKATPKQSSNGEKYLYLDSNEISESKHTYALLTIDIGSQNTNIKVIYSSSDVSQTILHPYTERLMWVYSNEETFFKIPIVKDKNINYQININALFGKLFLSISPNEIYSSMTGNFIVEGNPKISQTEQKETFRIVANNGNSLILVNYEESIKDKLFKIEKDVLNEIAFTLTESNDLFPQYGYIKMNKKENLYISLQFHNIKYDPDTEYDENKDIFNIYAYLIDEETMSKRIINSNTPIIGERIEGIYSVSEKIGYINITNTNDPLYAYLAIEKSELNTNVYKKIKMYLNTSQINEVIPLYHNIREYRNLRNQDEFEKYSMSSINESYKYIIVDIAEYEPVKEDLDFSIETSEKMEIVNKYGFKRIKIEKKENNQIILKINKIKDNELKKYTLIFYSIMNEEQDLGNFNKFDDTITMKDIKNENKTITFNNFKFKYNTLIKNPIYYIEVFKKNDKIKSFNDINTIYYNTDSEDIQYNTTIKVEDDSKEKISLTLPIKNEKFDKEYILRVIAEFYTSSSNYNQRFCYQKIKYEDENNSEDKKYLNTVFFVILGCFGLCVIIMAVIILISKLTYKQRKIKDDLEKLEQKTNNLKE